MELLVEIDYEQPFAGTEFAAWDLEYKQAVSAEALVPRQLDRWLKEPPGPAHDPFLADQFWDEFPPDPFLEPWDEQIDGPLYAAGIFGAG